MDCPQCCSNEISPAGICLVCGYEIPEQDSEPETGPAGFSGAINLDYSEGTADPDQGSELPGWRQELSERLNAIRQKRAMAAAGSQENKSAPEPLSAAQQHPVADELSALQARLLEKKPVRRQRQQPNAPRQIALQPIAEPKIRKPAAMPDDSEEIQRLIDRAISRHQEPADGFQEPELTPGYFPEKDERDDDGKLILLSRTLSGLVDLIVVVLCTGVFVIAADYFSGIVVLDKISMINLSALFLLIYFLYSLFFLGASNQTIGMMITELRVVGTGNRRPSMLQLYGRCLGHLVSLFGLGIGLVISLFDKGNRCFHDRQSGTYVVRL